MNLFRRKPKTTYTLWVNCQNCQSYQQITLPVGQSSVGSSVTCPNCGYPSKLKLG